MSDFNKKKLVNDKSNSTFFISVLKVDVTMVGLVLPIFQIFWTKKLPREKTGSWKKNYLKFLGYSSQQDLNKITSMAI